MYAAVQISMQLLFCSGIASIIFHITIMMQDRLNVSLFSFISYPI